jgi:hypothetical protein
VLGLEPPYPSVADAFYLACYALLAGGLLLLVRERAPGRDVASLIDATIITIGAGLLSWVFLIGPNVRAPDLLLSQRLVSIAYPLCDVLAVAVAVAVRLWRTGGHSTAASRLLTVGLVALLAADTVYGLSLLGGGWEAGGPGRRHLDRLLPGPGAGRPAPVDGLAERARPAEHPADPGPGWPCWPVPP